MGHALGNNYGKFYGFQSKPVLLDCQFTVDATNGRGVTGVKGQGVQEVYMHTSGSATGGNPNPANGYALIKLAYNYTRVYGGPWNALPPLTGSNLGIDASALTAGVPYQITAVGHSEAGAATINCIDDVSGALASTWFRLFDNYGNMFVIWFSVSGVGTAPTGTGGILVQQAITTNDTDDTIGDLLVLTIQALPVSPGSAIYSFTAASTTGTVTVTSTQHNPYQPLPGPPSDGVIPTGFAFTPTKYTSNLVDWQGVGLPKGVEPAVGAAFIATAVGYTTGGTSTGTVKAYGSTGIVGMEILGDPNLSLGPIPMGGGPNVGGWILVKFLAPTFSGTALGSHTHDLKIIGAQAASTTNDIAYYATDILGKEQATDATIAGSASTTKGGVVAVTGGTPAGTIAFGAGAPTAGTKFYMQFLLEQAARVGGNNE